MKQLGYSPWGNGTDIEPFNQVFPVSRSLQPVGVAKDLDAILLWGGTDINPYYYNQAHHYNSQASRTKDSIRDVMEWAWMIEAQNLGISIIGVCRGAQFLCAFAGGKLIQHMTGHHGDHSITTVDGRVYQSSSDHHQLMDLRGLKEGEDYVLLAWSTNKLSKQYENDNETLDDIGLEPEIVWFPKIRGLAIQGHPEWMDDGCDFNQYVLSLVRKYVLKEEEHA